MYPETTTQASRKKTKYLIITIIVLVVSIVAYNIYLAQSRSGKIAVEVTVLPKDATIYANDIRIKSGTAHLKPGKYTVTVSKEGFETDKQEIFINETYKYIQTVLAGTSTEAKEWERKHQKELLEFEGKVGETSRLTGDVFKTKYPITKLLPVNELVYKIGYTTNPDKSILTLTIHAITPQQRQAALQQIRDWGYDPTDYKITFADYINLLQTDSERDEHEDE